MAKTTQADNILQQHPNLNKKYPERRNKGKTYVVDFQAVETKKTALNDFEKECLTSISIDPSREMRLMLDFTLMVNKFPQAEQIILQKRREGWTEAEIADLINRTRRTVIRRLNILFGKLRQILK